MGGVLYEAEYNGRKLVVTQSHAGWRTLGREGPTPFLWERDVE